MSQLRALVTGASRGIGLAITKVLCEKGIRVVGLGKSEENLKILRKKLPTVETVCVNLADWNASREAVSNLGTFDYLVNNAAYAERVDALTMSHDDIERHFSVNIKSAVNLTQVVAQAMIKNGRGGAIVNVSSVSGEKPYKKMAAYAMSKAALNHFTRLMALELKPTDVAKVVAFLLSEDACMITGHNVPIDGGVLLT